jgi:hypothetical protein
LERALFQSKPWLSLTGASTQVYLIFAGKVQKEKVGRRGKEAWRMTNNGELEFTYLEATGKYGITNPRFTRAIDQLVDRGFIDIAHQGGGLSGECPHNRDKARYGLSERWRLWGTRDFKAVPRQKGRRWPPRKTATINENVGLQPTKTCAEEDSSANTNVRCDADSDSKSRVL